MRTYRKFRKSSPRKAIWSQKDTKQNFVGEVTESSVNLYFHQENWERRVLVKHTGANP